MRGKLHIECLSDDFPGDVEAGAAVFVSKIRAALNIRFPGGNGPKYVFTDRGNGFYNSGSGAITKTDCNALKAHKLKPFMGDNAAVQPGCLQEAMLHETAMAWVRVQLAKTTPKRCRAESVSDYHKRLKDVCAYINANFDVDGLCKELSYRVNLPIDNGGDRITK